MLAKPSYRYRITRQRRHRCVEQHAAVDGAHVLGAEEVCLVGGHEGEGAAHEGQRSGGAAYKHIERGGGSGLDHRGHQ